MRTNRSVGAATILGSVVLALSGGCDLVAGIGEYCVEGVDPGCGTGGNAGSGGTTSTGMGGASTTTSMGGSGTTTTSTGGGGAGGGPACTPPATQDCYTGPSGTEDVGLCKGGTQACTEEGTWGPCEGQTLPGVEDPIQVEDENCDGSASGNINWASIFGDNADQFAGEVGIDQATGDIYLAGQFAGTQQIGNTSFTAEGGIDAFVAKFSSAGNPLWYKSFSTPGTSRATAIVVDHQGNVIVAGTSSDSIMFEGSPTFNAGAFMVKLDKMGNYVWAQVCTGTGVVFESLAVDAQNNAYGAGSLNGTTDCGTGALTSMGTNTKDVLVVKRSFSNGSPFWANRYGDTQDQFALAIAVDSASDVVLAGVMFGVLDLGGGNLTDVSGGDAFVAKLSFAGDHKWSKNFGGEFPQTARAIAVAKGDDIIVTGQYTGTISFGADPLPSGSGDAFLARLSPMGTEVWSTAPGDGFPMGCGVTSGDDIVVVGSTPGTMDWGGGQIVGDDIFLARVTGPDASHVWSRAIGNNGMYGPELMSFAMSDNQVVVSGRLRGAVDLGGGTLTAQGTFDSLIMSIEP